MSKLNNLEINDGSVCFAKEIPESTDTEKLLKLMECPVCKEVAKPPIYTCIGNHHMICEGCREKLENSECPLCHSAVSAQRCAFAEKAMEHIALPCKYLSQGCKEILKGNMYRDHIDNCPVRPVDCIISKCKEKVPFHSYFEHLLNAHKNKVNGIENTREHSIEWWIQGSPQNSARWPPYFMTCFSKVFLYMAISTSHGMWEWVWIIGSEEEAKRFQVISKHIGTENPTQLEWKGPVHSIRKTIPQIVESGLCFVTNCKEIRNPFLYRKPDEPNYFYWRTEAKIIEVDPPYPNSIPYLPTIDQEPEPVPCGAPTANAAIPKTNLKQNPVMESKSVQVELSLPVERSRSVSGSKKLLEQIQLQTTESPCKTDEPMYGLQETTEKMQPASSANINKGSRRPSKISENEKFLIDELSTPCGGPKVSQVSKESITPQMRRASKTMEPPLPPPIPADRDKLSPCARASFGVESKSFILDEQPDEEPKLDYPKKSGPIASKSKINAKKEISQQNSLTNIRKSQTSVISTKPIGSPSPTTPCHSELKKKSQASIIYTKPNPSPCPKNAEIVNSGSNSEIVVIKSKTSISPSNRISTKSKLSKAGIENEQPPMPCVLPKKLHPPTEQTDRPSEFNSQERDNSQ